jgi:hypothetical protein
MDPAILENTKEYAKPTIAMRAMNAGGIQMLDTKLIYVPKPNDTNDHNAWDAALVDGLTQSRKTWKAFDLIATRVRPVSNTLVLFVTQANNITSVNQIISRSKRDDGISRLFASIERVSQIDTILFDSSSNLMLVDFWNSRNMDIMLDVVRQHPWNEIFVVIDEAEQGGKNGLKTRLEFIREIEKAQICPVRIILITATVANLTKSIVEIANNQKAKYGSGVVNKIINEKVVEHHYVIPHDAYVGPSWFIEGNPSLLKIIKMPRKMAGMSDEDIQAKCDEVIYAELDKLTAEQKELALIVTSTKQMVHRISAMNMFMIGFNVAVEMNSGNNKNFNVFYRGTGGITKQWQIPVCDIESMVGRGMLEKYVDGEGIHSTDMAQKEDITIPHILQAALFMNTASQKRIVDNVKDPQELIKLKALSAAICASLEKSKRRPDDWPGNPRVALIAGHIAGRGNTFQNPMIDLACTAFCFTGKSDRVQRGATNAQKIGRACGLLGDIFVTQMRRPVMIATKAVLEDALSNELALREKAMQLENGELVSLKELITKSDWDRAISTSMKKMASEKIEAAAEISKDTAVMMILQMIADADGVASLSWVNLQAYDTRLYKMLKKQNKRLVHEMFEGGLLEQANKRSMWRITDTGRIAVQRHKTSLLQ